MTKVAIYARVSTDSQSERQTISTQLDACHTHCQQKGYEVAATFRDEGVSGAVPFDQRPAGGQLLAAARDGRFTCVVIFCVDRLGRDVVEGVLADKDLTKAGAPAEFVSQSFDDTPEGEFMFTTFLAVAQLERATIRRRMMGGQQRRLREGYKARGRDPYGYKWNSEARRFDVVPAEADLIRSILQRYVGGEGVKAIAISLTESGTLSPDGQRGHKAGNARWEYQTVHRLLTRECYSTGRIVGEFQGQGYSLPVPPIIDGGLSGRVKARLESARHFPRRPGTKGLFQGLLTCGSCGRTYHRGNYGTKNSSNYFCPARRREAQRTRGTRKCLSPNLSMRLTDAALWKGLLEALRDPEPLAAAFLAGVDGEITTLRLDLGEQADLDGLREKRDYAFQQLSRPGSSLATIKAEVADLDKQIGRAERRLRGKEAEIARLQVLQARKHNLLYVLEHGDSAIMEVQAYAPDGRVPGTLVPLGVEDDLSDWLAGERKVMVKLVGDVEPPPGFIPANASARGTRFISRIYMSTADRLLDYLGAKVAVLPSGQLELVGRAIYWRTEHSASQRSHG